MPLSRTMIRWLPIAAAFSILPACTETVPIEVVLLGVGNPLLDRGVVCVNGRELGTIALDDGARIGIPDDAGLIEIAAPIDGGGFAWGAATLDAHGPVVRVALSPAHAAAHIDLPEDLKDLVDPRIASVSDGRVVIVGWDDAETGGAWLWDVLGDTVEWSTSLPVRGADYSVTAFDDSRVLVAGGSDQSPLQVLDVASRSVAEVDDPECDGAPADGSHGASAFFVPPGSERSPRVLLAGGGEDRPGSDRALVFEPESSPRCAPFTLGAERFSPVVVPVGAESAVVFDDTPTHEVVKPDYENAAGGWRPLWRTHETRRQGHSGTWVTQTSLDSAWILGGTVPGEASCSELAVRLARDSGEASEIPFSGVHRSGHAAVQLDGGILIVGGTGCGGEPGEAARSATVIDVTEGEPSIAPEGATEYDINLGSAFCRPRAAPVAPGAVLVVGRRCQLDDEPPGPCICDSGPVEAVLVNPGPHPADESPCAADPSEHGSEDE